MQTAYAICINLEKWISLKKYDLNWSKKIENLNHSRTSEEMEFDWSHWALQALTALPKNSARLKKRIPSDIDSCREHEIKDYAPYNCIRTKKPWL
jgi:hypothetical protein